MHPTIPARPHPARPRRAAVALALLAALTAPGAARAADADVTALLDGVRTVASPGVPGPLCVYGDDAFPLVVGGGGGETRLPAVAAARLGRGRVVVFGHDGYLSPDVLDSADTGRLLENAVRWAAGGRSRPRLATIDAGAAAGWLRGRGFAVDEVAVSALGGHDVAIVVPWDQDDAFATALSAFVANGGGVVLAATGWGWAQLHPGAELRTAYLGNRLLAPAGIQWPYDWLEETAPGGGYDVAGAPTPLSHGGRALDVAIEHDAGRRVLSPSELRQISRTVVMNASCAPPGDTLFLPRVRAVTSAVVVPSPEDPVSSDEVLDRLAVVLQTRDLDALPASQARAHPAAARFPGAVPADAARVTRTVVVGAAVAGEWIGTGLYAPPGEPVTLRLPADRVGDGLTVQIGSHTDTLWGVEDGWRRMPDIVRRWSLDAPETRVSSPYGGLIYVVPSRGIAAEVAIEVSGAVEAPLFKLGETDPVEWRSRLRLAPAPWAEIQGRHMVVTTRSSDVRGLDDPAAVARAWDEVVSSAAALTRRTDPDLLRRPERFVADEQISAGYMHSGYPLMCHLDQAGNLASETALRAGNWGFFHEVGHNFQGADYTFDGTVEVTVNLFTLFIYERVAGTPVKANERGSEAFVREQLAKVDWDAPDFAHWQSDPFLALSMYVMLQHEFGWEAYLRVFEEYAALDEAERPRTDAQKRDQWLMRFSRAVGRDLGPFFEAWGVPTSPEARAAVADLAAWMPLDFPPGYRLDPTPTATATSPPTATNTPALPPAPSATPVDRSATNLYLPALGRA